MSNLFRVFTTKKTKQRWFWSENEFPQKQLPKVITNFQIFWAEMILQSMQTFASKHLVIEWNIG